MTDFPAHISNPFPLARVSEAQVPAHPGMGGFRGDFEPEESAIRQYWRVFYRRRWVIVAIVASCVAAALLLSMMTERQYTATARIQVAREAAKVIDMKSADEKESAGGGPEFYHTQYALLKSRSLSEAVVRALNLSENYAFLSNYEAEADDLRRMSGVKRFELATSIVNRGTIVSPIRGSSIIDVGFESPDPAMAATIANALAEQFIETNLSRQYEATAYARQFLQNRLAAVRNRLEESERRATEYARAQGIINIGPQGGDGQQSGEQSLPSADLAQLSAQLSIARAARAQAEADYRANSGGNAAATSLTNPAVNELRRQRAQLTAELRKLQSDFGPEYPQVVALQAQIGELNRQISSEEGLVTSSVNSSIRDKYRQALAAEQGLQARVNGLKSAVLDQQQRSIQLNIIQRDVDTNRELYNALLQRYKEIGVTGGVGTNNVSIVDRALTPGAPSSPNVPLNVALGLIIGLVLGVGVALLLEQLAESVILPAEFEQKLGIPLLGSTPFWKQTRGNSQSENESALTEAYYSILTAVQFSTANGAPKTIAVTSSGPGEGKSTTALALARGLSKVGRRVLIIDGDMRNPSLHRSFGLSIGRGLSELMTGKAGLEELIHQSSGEPAVLLSGQIPPNPAELLASGVLSRILETASKIFDHVIVDCPPVLGLADAPLIACSTEGTIFIVESGRTRATQARQAIRRLLGVQAHILGAVLTKLNSRTSGYGYGYGYNYQYGSHERQTPAYGLVPARHADA